MALELRPSDQLVFASKSGRTLELWAWIGRLRGLPGWGRWERPPRVITQDDGNPLATWARREGFPILPFPQDVGGRFSAFTAIGTPWPTAFASAAAGIVTTLPAASFVSGIVGKSAAA